MQYYYILVVLASFLAGAGFASNCASAIIGSALVAPLGQPLIEGTKGWGGLFKIWGISTAICIAIGYACGKTLLHPSSPDTSEMISRTNWKENVFASLLIPVIAGAILAIALKQKDTSLVIGVGISVMILAPLVETGMHIARKKTNRAKSTLHLALVNLFALSLSYLMTKEFL